MTLIHNSIKTVVIVTILALGVGIVIGISVSVEAQSSPPIPAWIKNTAKWWAEGQVSDSEFISALQYLVNQKILVIPSNVKSSTTATTDTPSTDKTELSGILYNVTDVKLSMGNIFAKPDGKYLIIFMTIENTGTTTTTIMSEQLELIDGKNRHFKVSDNYFSENPELLSYEELQPDLPVKRQVAFDVPFDQDLMYEIRIRAEAYDKDSESITIKLGMGKDFT